LVGHVELSSPWDPPPDVWKAVEGGKPPTAPGYADRPGSPALSDGVKRSVPGRRSRKDILQTCPKIRRAVGDAVKALRAHEIGLRGMVTRLQEAGVKISSEKAASQWRDDYLALSPLTD